MQFWLSGFFQQKQHEQVGTGKRFFASKKIFNG
jgi:hypothetical protein